jgi:FkbM family methyltransferase
MGVFTRIKELISAAIQRAIGLDEVRYNLRVTLRTLEKLHQIEEKIAQLESASAWTEASGAVYAQIEALTNWMKRMSLQIDQLQDTTLSGALRRLQGHQIEIASLIDVGASNGRWSSEFAKYFPGRHHLLLDANRIHLSTLTKVCRENSNWDFALTAVGATQGELYFDDSDPLGGHLAQKPLTDQYRPCPVTSIDALVDKFSLPAPFMIKLDTHGVEIPILAGAARTLKQTNVIVIEAYNFNLQEPAVPFWDLCRHMVELGFRPLDVFDLLYRELDSAFWQFDLLFVRSDLPLFQDNRFFVSARH